MVLGHQVADHATQFGQPVRLDEVGVRPGLQRGAQQRQRHRRGAVGVGLQRAEQLDRVLAGLQHLGQHGRHQERAVGALQDRAGQRGTVDVARHHARDPVVNAELGVRRAADVEQRHRHHVLVAVVELESLVAVDGVRDEVGLRQRHALGRPVVPEEYMMMQTSSGSTSARAADGRRRREHRLVLVAVRAVRGDLDDVLDIGQRSRILSIDGFSSAPTISTLAPESLST